MFPKRHNNRTPTFALLLVPPTCIPNQFLNTRQSSAWDKILLRLHFVYYVNTWYVCTWKDGQTNRAKLNEISVNGRWNCLIALNIRVGVKFFNDGRIKKYYDKMRCTQTFIFRIASGSLCWIVNSYMREFMSDWISRFESRDLRIFGISVEIGIFL